jgi:hypothetical protein
MVTRFIDPLRDFEEIVRWLEDPWRGGGVMPMDAYLKDDAVCMVC